MRANCAVLKVYGKNGFIEVSKNLTRSENNFVGLSKKWCRIARMSKKLFAALPIIFEFPT